MIKLYAVACHTYTASYKTFDCCKSSGIWVFLNCFQFQLLTARHLLLSFPKQKYLKKGDNHVAKPLPRYRMKKKWNKEHTNNEKKNGKKPHKKQKKQKQKKKKKKNKQNKTKQKTPPPPPPPTTTKNNCKRKRHWNGQQKLLKKLGWGRSGVGRWGEEGVRSVLFESKPCS